MIFVIGPHDWREVYEIDDSLESWVLIDWIPTCAHCHKQLHLEFDTQAGIGTSECWCVEDCGGTKRREIQRKFVRVK
jgi:hypothetical protein